MTLSRNNSFKSTKYLIIRHFVLLLIAAPIGLALGWQLHQSQIIGCFIIWGLRHRLSYTASSIYADHSCSCNDPSCTLCFC